MKSPSRNSWLPLISFAFTLAILAIVEGLSFTDCAIPNPEALFLTAVAFSAFMGGFWWSLAGASAVLFYSLYHFSLPGQPLHYAPEDLTRILILTATTPVVALFSGIYQTRSQQIIQARARETEVRFHDLVQGLDAIVWEADPMMRRFTFVSRRAESILGYRVQQWLEEYDFWSNHIHPEDRAAAVAFRQTALGQDKDHNYEYRMMATNNRVVWFRDRVQLLRNKEGKIQQIRGIMVDTTERRASEDALRESVRRFREMLENVRLAAVGLDLQGHITLCNDYLLTQTGWQRQEILGGNWFEIFIPADLREQEFRLFSESIVQGKIASHCETPIVTRTGARRSISWNNGFLKDTQGKIIGTISLGEDVTGRNRLQDELRQAQKMEAIGRLTGGVAHDFNNLLTAILGYSELLLLKLPTDDPLQKNAEEIRKAAERASSLTNQLLAFSRKQVLAPQVLDLNTIVANMDKILRRLIGEDIDLVTLLNSGLGRVKADSGQIEQVILNLAVNARDAMPQGGKLTVETANLEIDESHAQHYWNIAPGRYVMLAVSDTGCGMDDEVKSHLFEPFFTTKEVGKGTGLGLSTVYGIVRQSGGGIDILSEPGRGSVFKIYLPEVSDVIEPTPLVQEPLLVVDGSETVLVVEDEMRVRNLICEVLTMHGYQVLEAAQGQEALQISERYQGPVHLMVTDMVMPGINGQELARQISKQRPEIKILFISGYTGSDLFQDGSNQAAKNFLQKPFRPEAFKRKVREILDSPSAAQ